MKLLLDENIPRQLRREFPIPVIVLSAYRITYKYLQPLIPKLNEVLVSDLQNGPFIIRDE